MFSRTEKPLSQIAVDFRTAITTIAALKSETVDAVLSNTDILPLIFSCVAQLDRPTLCSCADHAPTQAELKQRRCCKDFPQCRRRREPGCVIGRPLNPVNCVYNLGWVKLGHVCRQWRSVLQGMSKVWADDLCALNNSALVAFLSYAGSSPLTIDLTPETVQNMVHPATRRERAELLRPHVHEACVLRSGWYDWTPASLERPLPLLKTLALSTEVPSTVKALTLQHAVSNDGPIYHQPTHVISDGTIILDAPSLRTLHLRSWSLGRYQEIPRMLTTVASIDQLVLELDALYFAPPASDEDDAQSAQEVLNIPDDTLHLPSLLRIEMTGSGAGHPTIRRLLADLTTDPFSAIRRISVHRVETSFLQSEHTRHALQKHIYDMRPDRIYLQFRDNSGLFVLSVAREDSSCNPEDCPIVSIGLNIRANACVDILKETLFPLFPLDEINHLYIDSLPAASGIQFHYSAALRQLSSVHTLHLRHGQVESSSLLSVGTYPMVGMRMQENPWLPTLTHLHIAYPTFGFSKTWWKELSAALLERQKYGVPFSVLRILLHRDAFHLDTDTIDIVQHLLKHASLGGAINIPDDSLDGLGALSSLNAEHNRWTKDKIETYAKNVLGQAVQAIEVVEDAQDGWPLDAAPWPAQPNIPGYY